MVEGHVPYGRAGSTPAQRTPPGRMPYAALFFLTNKPQIKDLMKRGDPLMLKNLGQEELRTFFPGVIKQVVGCRMLDN